MRFIEGDPPPSPRRANTNYARIFAALRERPGVWAEVEKGKLPTMRAYASRYRGLAGGLYEFRATPDDGAVFADRGILYGRYVGTNEEDS